MKFLAFVTRSSLKTITIAGAALALLGSPSYAAKPAEVTFALHVNPAFKACLRKDANTTPRAVAKVVRGAFNDTLSLNLAGFKPNLDFDVFTVQRSNLLANATVNPNFTNFGLAWYQSDLHTNSGGAGSI